jgi:hypothetical protein
MAAEKRIRTLGRALVTASTIFALPGNGPATSLLLSASVARRSDLRAPDRDALQTPAILTSLAPPRISIS